MFSSVEACSANSFEVPILSSIDEPPVINSVDIEGVGVLIKSFIGCEVSDIVNAEVVGCVDESVQSVKISYLVRCVDGLGENGTVFSDEVFLTNYEVIYIV